MSENTQAKDIAQDIYASLPPLPDDGEGDPFAPQASQASAQAPNYYAPQVATPPMPQPMQQFQPNMIRPGDAVPRFRMVAKRLPDGTFHNVEYVSLLTPGDNKAVAERKVTPYLREKYRYQYDMWRQGIETGPTGTPLEIWPGLNASQVAMLKANNVFTVEQLRDAPDSCGAYIPMFRTLKMQAGAFLENKDSADAAASRETELNAMRQGMSMLEKQNAELMEKLNELLTEKKQETSAKKSK